MFLDEARLAADLRHPNVVNVFDVGMDQGTYFIAMEYLHGQDLSSLWHKHRERGEQMPLEHALQALSDAAAGLHYAHTKTSMQGEPLQLVHRDVSPQNLFLTYDGQTKVLDFGIARPRKSSVSTDEGVLKGKYAYLAPEALDGADVDARADQFALGIVLFELTTLSRLFARPSDAEVLRAVMECRVPRPKTLVPGYPEALEDIVMRALHKDPEQRYPDCETLRSELEGYLDKHGRPHSASRLGAYTRALFAEHFKSAPGSAPPESTSAKPSDAAARRADEPTRADGSQRKRVDTGKIKTARRKLPPLPDTEEFLAAVQKFLEPMASERKTTLVPAMDPFIGRAADLTAVTSLFEKGARLVTVAGFGGMGKTRLALRLLELEREKYADDGGTWFVDLADARNADDICKAVERALDVGAVHAGSARDTVTYTGRTLAGLGRALVVLDNFEQIVSFAAETIGVWLELAPDVRFVVTTREALRLPGERVHPLEPMDAASDAVKLFLSRAERAGAKIPSTAADLAAVGQICRALDGHPLALELAAARLSSHPPRVILEKLSERFALLGGREASGRHATLWNAIDWSYQMLSAAERKAFEQLSVFRGGFTLEAAQEVAACGHEVIEALHRKSLLRVALAPELPQTLRLAMLESIAAFATEKLAESDRLDDARARHAAWFLTKGDQWAEDVHGHAAHESLKELAVERENLLEVFERGLSAMPSTSETATRALRALITLLDGVALARKGPFNSHLALLDSAISVAQGVKLRPAYHARALQQRGNVRRNRGQLAEAVQDLSDAAMAVKLAKDEPLEGRILCDLGVACFVTGDLPRAEHALEEALALTRKVGDLAFEVRSLSYLAILELARDNVPEALSRCDEALPLTRKRGDAVSEARVLGTIGGVYLEDDKPELADAFFGEAQARCISVGEQRLCAYFQAKQGITRVELGNLDGARKLLEAAVETLSEVEIFATRVSCSRTWRRSPRDRAGPTSRGCRCRRPSRASTA